ncbi:MAG TPA: DHHA1 domain-containing protein [Candidatus Doudnabacteria bacterium]|nr:DHHA1 domain-containing protein [Candidatus Doudnabacteria bacterium]
MEKSFQNAKTLIEKSAKILLTTHERTDGDDLGSVLALAHHLWSQGKRATVAVTAGVPPRLNFMPGSDRVFDDISDTNFDLLIVSGCSILNRVNNPKIEGLKIPKINFDHHPDNKNFGDVNVVEASKSSVAELMYDFLTWCKWEITSDMATNLLTGIVTDTGLLMHSNTQASTLTTASELMKKGALISDVANHTFTAQSPRDMNAWGKAIESAHYNSKTKMIYAVITEEHLKELGNPDLATFEGVVETLNKVPEAEYAMFLKEEGGRVKGSLRSEEYKGVDVQKIAQSLGGGGHKLAAGFSMVGKLSKNAEGRWEIL